MSESEILPVLRVSRPAADVLATMKAGLGRGLVLHGHPLSKGEGGEYPPYATWHVAGLCKRPILVRQDGYSHYSMPREGLKGVAPIGLSQDGARLLSSAQGLVFNERRSLDMAAPCRQCSECLRARASLWGGRSVGEWKLGETLGKRSWFGTLTIRAADRYRLRLATCHRLGVSLEAFEAMPKGERFSELHRTTGAEVTEWIKRLRKGSKRDERIPLTLRYFLTVEPHRDGFPHYHIVLHDHTDMEAVAAVRIMRGPDKGLAKWSDERGQPLPRAGERQLRKSWLLGFTRWKLVKSDGAATYTAKYLSKASNARVRASRRYGRIGEGVSLIQPRQPQGESASLSPNPPKGICCPTSSDIGNCRENIDPHKRLFLPPSGEDGKGPQATKGFWGTEQ